jgi:hypothetical protein
MQEMDWWRRDSFQRWSVPPGPCSICRMVSPEGNSILEILLGSEGIAEVRGVNGSDGRVRPKEALPVPPQVVGMLVMFVSPPLHSLRFSRFKPCICSPPLGSGVLHFVALCGFGEDLDEYVDVHCLVEDVELALPARRLGGNELGTFFKGEDQQGERFDVVSGVASID